MREMMENTLGPIFAKEMISQARQWRFFLYRILFGLGLLFLLFALWENAPWKRGSYMVVGNQVMYQPPSGYNIKMMAVFAERTHLAVMIAMFWVLAIFVPILCCGLISNEREKTTRDLLLTTQLKHREIVVGKLMSRMATIMLFILFFLPVFSLILLMGGIDPERMFWMTLTTLVTCLLIGSHAIYFSTITKTFLGSMVRTYFRILLVYGLIPLAFAFLTLEILKLELSGWFRVILGGVILAYNPFFLFMIISNPQAILEANNFAGFSIEPVCLIIPLLWSVVLLWRSCVHLREDPKPPRFTVWDLLHVPGMLVKWGIRQIPYSFLNGIRQALPKRVTHPTKERQTVANPFWQRSRLAKIYDREGYLQRIQKAAWIIAWGMILMIGLDHFRDLQNNDVSIGFIPLCWFAVGILVLLVSGSSLVGDRRRGFLEPVLISPVTSREILDGTILAVWEHLRLILWLPVVFTIFFLVISDGRSGVQLDGAILAFGTSLLFVILLTVVGVGCSVAARNDATALIGCISFPLFAILGPLLIAAALEEEHGPFLWGIVLALFLFLRYRVQHRDSVFVVAGYLLSVHLLITCLFSAWTYSYASQRNPYPALGMNAGIFSAMPLDTRAMEREFNKVPIVAMIGCHWLALIVSIVWIRYWLIRNFARLVGRIEGEYEPETLSQEPKQLTVVP